MRPKKAAKTASEEVLTYRHFADMEYAELFREVKKMLAQAKRMHTWFATIEQVNLLPALQALRDKVAQPGRRSDLGERDPDNPNWEEVCRLLDLNPETVKKWRQRTQANTDIRHLLGEAAGVARPKLTPEQQSREAVRHLQQLVSAVLNGDEQDAEVIALALAERYGF